MHHTVTIVMFVLMFLGPCFLASSFERREREASEYDESTPGEGLRASAYEL